MVSKVFSVRLEDDLAAWVEEQAQAAGEKPGPWLKALVAARKDRPEQPTTVQPVTSYVGPKQAPVGECPKNEAGHEWASAKDDPRRSCVHCGRPGRDGIERGVPQIGGFFAEATAARTELFNRLRTPDSIKKGYPKKAA
jgi:hypothetical protein